MKKWFLAVLLALSVFCVYAEERYETVIITVGQVCNGGLQVNEDFISFSRSSDVVITEICPISDTVCRVTAVTVGGAMDGKQMQVYLKKQAGFGFKNGNTLMGGIVESFDYNRFEVFGKKAISRRDER